MLRLPRMFRSIENRNYRLYSFGQQASLLGSWLQSVAQAWLVYRRTLPGISRAKIEPRSNNPGAKPKRSENRTIIRPICSWHLERGLGPMRSLHR
jgi:hypothetical protein